MKFNGHILAQKYSIQVYYTGVLSFEKGFIFLIYLISIDQNKPQKDLNWIFCERSQSILRIKRKGLSKVCCS